MAAGDDRCIGFAVQKPFEPCAADVLLGDGEVLSVGDLQITSHASPGHCDGLVIFEIDLDGERVWFTGDLFEARQRHEWINLPWTGDPHFDRAQYIQSLARLRGLPRPEHILPGHGPAAIGNAGRLLDMAYNEALVSWR
jgi:glyoxylase-like metal-dependent hydrolase (beta-lactamase superfamily II)